MVAPLPWSGNRTALSVKQIPVAFVAKLAREALPLHAGGRFLRTPRKLRCPGVWFDPRCWVSDHWARARSRGTEAVVGARCGDKKVSSPLPSRQLLLSVFIQDSLSLGGRVDEFRRTVWSVFWESCRTPPTPVLKTRIPAPYVCFDGFSVGGEKGRWISS